MNALYVLPPTMWLDSVDATVAHSLALLKVGFGEMLRFLCIPQRECGFEL